MVEYARVGSECRSDVKSTVCKKFDFVETSLERCLRVDCREHVAGQPYWAAERVETLFIVKDGLVEPCHNL